MYTHKAHHSGEIYDFSIFVAFFRPSVVFKRGAFWSAPFSENNLLYWIQNIFQSQLLTPKIEKVMPGQKSPFLNYHLSNEIHIKIQVYVSPKVFRVTVIYRKIDRLKITDYGGSKES